MCCCSLELPKLSVRISQENLRRAARRYLPLDSYLDAVWSPADPANLREAPSSGSTRERRTDQANRDTEEERFDEGQRP